MRKKFTAYIEEDNLKELKIKAIDLECSVADILNDLVEEYLKKEKATIQGVVSNENE